MRTPVLVIGGCAIVTFAIKAAGPVMSGGREIPPAVREVLVLLAPALLAALVVVEALANEKHLSIDAETGGVAASGLVYWSTRSIVWCVVVAAAMTAGLRAL
jgi:branched-subunit amino acid transport protein